MYFFAASRFLISSLKSSREFSCSNSLPTKNSNSWALLSLQTSRSFLPTTDSCHISATWVRELTLSVTVKLMLSSNSSRAALLRKRLILFLRLQECLGTRKCTISVEGSSWLRSRDSSVWRESRCSLSAGEGEMRACSISSARLTKIVSTPLLLFIFKYYSLPLMILLICKKSAAANRFRTNITSCRSLTPNCPKRTHGSPGSVAPRCLSPPAPTPSSAAQVSHAGAPPRGNVEVESDPFLRD